MPSSLTTHRNCPLSKSSALPRESPVTDLSRAKGLYRLGIMNEQDVLSSVQDYYGKVCVAC